MVIHHTISLYDVFGSSFRYILASSTAEHKKMEIVVVFDQYNSIANLFYSVMHKDKEIYYGENLQKAMDTYNNLWE
jgi:hypothetical protein